MKCPVCSTLETKVVDSRMNQTRDIIRRRRQCHQCESRFTTYERVEIVMPVVIKRDGRREAFSRDKILGGVQKACQKRSVGAHQLENLLSRIERKIQSWGLKEIPSETIGRMIMSLLHDLDPVAYIRFASVYRKFKDVDEFVAELKEQPDEAMDDYSLSFPFVVGPDGNESTKPE